ncbi:MAG: hypothetical protein ACXVBE_13570 [Bdellovibrionota bacterium]
MKNLLLLFTLSSLFGSLAQADDSKPLTLSCKIDYSRLNKRKDDLIFDNIAPVESVLERNSDYPRNAIDVERSSSDGRYKIILQGIQPLAGDPAFKVPLMRLMVLDQKTQISISSGEVYVVKMAAPYNRANLHITSTADTDKPANGLSVNCELK